MLADDRWYEAGFFPSLNTVLVMVVLVMVIHLLVRLHRNDTNAAQLAALDMRIQVLEYHLLGEHENPE